MYATIDAILYILLTILQDSTIDFEKRRNVPVRYDRELVQTTIKAMKRIAEIKTRRERVFFKHRYGEPLLSVCILNFSYRVAAAREKQRAHRKKKLEAIKASVKLHEPMVVDSVEKTREKIKVPAKARSALVQGDGRSMSMVVD